METDTVNPKNESLTDKLTGNSNRELNREQHSAASGCELQTNQAQVSINDMVEKVFQVLEGRKPNSSRHKLDALLNEQDGWDAVEELLSHPLCVALLKQKDHPVPALCDAVTKGYAQTWIDKAVKSERNHPVRRPASADTPQEGFPDEGFEDEDFGQESPTGSNKIEIEELE
jgi:hypothetical protein